MKTTI